MGVVSLDVVSVIGQSGGSQCECGQSGCGQWVWWSVWMWVCSVRVWVWSMWLKSVQSGCGCVQSGCGCGQLGCMCGYRV